MIEFILFLFHQLRTRLISAVRGGLILLVLVTVFRFLLLRRRYAQIRHKLRNHLSSAKVVLGFFHPYCSGGGGGERVLWKMIQDIGILCDRGFSVQIVIYTIDPPTPTYPQQLLQQIQERFDILISKQLPIQFVHLHAYAHYLQPAPHLSLLVESYGTIRLAVAALEWHVSSTQAQALPLPPLPDWFIDTTGCAFTFLVARLLYGCRIMAYVHYPTISTDMLQLVWERRRNTDNHSLANNWIMTYGKLLYYCFFAVLYGVTGSLADIVFVNSQWTRAHIQQLWKWSHWKKRIRLLYPPCRVQQQTAVLQQPRDNVILSIGQFRPEKDHPLQIESFYRFIQKYPEWRGRVQLILIGSCRGPGDEERLSRLRALVQQYQLSATDVDFVVNQPYSVLQQWLARASVGIHTMWNEHFGIGIVEMMDAGLIVVAHNSGGPQTDIISPGVNGYLATTADEYADALHQALSNEKNDYGMRRKAKESSARFSDEEFSNTFQHAILSAKVLHP